MSKTPLLPQTSKLSGVDFTDLEPYQNLLDIDQIEEQEWFEQFEKLEGTLTRCLLLIAMLHNVQLISDKEQTMFKKMVFTQSDKRNKEILGAFSRSRSLYSVRSEFRGRLGLPRLQKQDSQLSPNLRRQGSVVSRRSSWSLSSAL